MTVSAGGLLDHKSIVGRLPTIRWDSGLAAEVVATITGRPNMRGISVHDDVNDHATLERHYERLQALYADLEHSPSKETIAAMLGVCVEVRRVDNPLYRYVVEQIVWIKGALKSLEGVDDLASVHQGITRLGRALRSPALRVGDAATKGAAVDRAKK